MSTISIEDLKTLGTTVSSELKKSHEPTEEMKKVLSITESVVKGASFDDPKTEEHFYGEFLGKISKEAMKTYYFKDKEV